MTRVTQFVSMNLCSPLFLALGLASLHASAAAPPFVAGLAGNKTASTALSGTLLIGELGCVACHASSQPAFAAKPGPDLTEVSTRVNGAHLQRFIASPSGVKPGTTMPDVLGHLPEAQRDEAANALAHYLATLGGDLATSTQPKPDAIDRGRKLYHSLGCVACHSPESPLPDSVPLGPLEEKYSVTSLTQLLESPLAVRPGGRMPDLKLDHFEARDIASYLLRNQTSTLSTFQVDAQLAARGKTLFAQHRCDACHSVKGARSLPVSVALEKLRPDQGCLSGKPGAWPRYPLTDEQHTAIRTALSTSAKPFSVAENVELTLMRFNCIACHQRGEIGGVPANRQEFFMSKDENLGDQGRIPPTLTGVGAKLKAGWLRDVVVNGALARPYLHTRMPRFGAGNTEALAGWLKQLDTLPPAEFAPAPQADKPHEIGRELLGTKGFNCIACHTFRERSAGAIHALDLMTMTDRIEENWFHHYLANPQRFSPLTIMPNFWPDGKSPLPDSLDGDPGKQRDALWQYLLRGPEAREPQGLILEPLIVAVTNEAVMIRRAFPGIGKRGIGVGYPAGINLAFDAGQVRLSSIWSGGFIEASPLWRGQGSGQARILGKDTVNFPPGIAFAVLNSQATPWPTNLAKQAEGLAFKGYFLDAQQRPTFQYEFEGVPIEDAFLDVKIDDGKSHLTRSIKFPKNPPPNGLHFRVVVDKVIEARSEREYAVGRGLMIRLPASGVIRDQGDTRELLLPVTGAFTIEYHLLGKP